MEISMKCPYKHKQQCKQIDTSGMTMLRECNDCDWYCNGIIETGGAPILEWILKLFGYGNNYKRN